MIFGELLLVVCVIKQWWLSSSHKSSLNARSVNLIFKSEKVRVQVQRIFKLFLVIKRTRELNQESRYELERFMLLSFEIL